MYTRISAFLKEAITFKQTTDEDSFVLNALDGSRVVGTARCEVYDEYMLEYFCSDYMDYDDFMREIGSPDKALYLEHLKVEEEYQGSHIATSLMDRVKKLATKKGCPCIVINASPMDGRDVRQLASMYRHWGFEEYKMDVKNCIMYMKLGGPVTESKSVRTLKTYHGGNLDELFDFSKATSASRYEYGPGLYLTTNYNVAKKYARGNRKLYMVTIEEGTDISDVMLDMTRVTEFVKSNVIKSRQKDYMDRLSKYVIDGRVKARLFNNILLNEKVLQTSKLKDLRQFYIDNGIDYELVDNAFGWGETMVVLFNMNKIVDKRVIRESDIEFKESLPTEFSLNERAEPVRNISDIIDILAEHGIRLSKKQSFYNRANYAIGAEDVEGKSDYLHIPIKVKSQGVIVKNGILQNFYYHTGDEFATTRDIHEFIRAVNGSETHEDYRHDPMVRTSAERRIEGPLEKR